MSFAVITLLLDVAIITLTAFRWELVDSLPFCLLLWPFMLGGWPIVILLIIVSIGSLAYQIGKPSLIKFHFFVLLFLNVATLLVLVFTPLDSLIRTAQFHLSLPAYQGVIKLVESGLIRPESNKYALLPLEYRYLSKGGGQIIIEKSDGVSRVFFFTFRGVLDNFFRVRVLLG